MLVARGTSRQAWLVGLGLLALCGHANCGYEDPTAPAPLLSIGEWPSGLVGKTTGIHAVVAASADAELAPYATFALDDIQIAIDGSVMNVSFSLPPGLVGDAAPVILAGGRDGELVVLRSDDGGIVATCELDATMFCTIDYGEIIVDDQGVATYWGEADPDAQAAHLEVASVFAAQPSGTMDILLHR